MTSSFARGRAACAALALASFACTRAVSREVVDGRAGTVDLRPAVLERSGPVQPEWTDGSMRQALGEVGFVGQASAADLAAARELATRELHASIASFVSVDVVSEAHDERWQRTAGGVTAEGGVVSSRVATKSEVTLSSVAVDAQYWERVAESPLAPGASRYDVWVHAWVPKAEIVRARSRKQASRAESTGRTSVVVLPIRTVDAQPAPVRLAARGLAEDLGSRLGRSRKLHVAEPAMVRALTAGADLSETEQVERVQDGLLPDWIVAGALEVEGARAELALSLYDARTGQVQGSWVRAVDDEALPELARVGAGWVARQLHEVALEEVRPRRGRSTREARAEARGVERRAFEAYHQAAALAEAGELERALGEVDRALALRPERAAFHLRKGRVLEKLGRFGRITQVASARAEVSPSLEPCTEAGRRAELRAREAIAARRRAIEARTAGGAAWWTAETLTVEQALAEGWALLGGGATAAPRTPEQARAAAESYVEAMRLAASTDDLHTFAEAALALADLAARTDQLAGARQVVLALLPRLEAAGDLHLRSLAYYSLGVISRRAGALDDARASLSWALQLRVILGEKPYVLEIENELGELAFESHDYAGAEAYHAAALNLAEQLGNEYLRAVLENNVGVLDLVLGRAGRAEQRFQRAASVLSELGESEGRVASGLNVARVTAMRGDPAGALQQMSEVARVLDATTQEGRFAELEAERGVVEAERGEVDRALEALATSVLLERALGDAAAIERTEASLIAAELGAVAREPRARREEALACLAARSAARGAVLAGEGAEDARVLAARPTRRLVLDASAAVLFALTSREPPRATWLRTEVVGWGSPLGQVVPEIGGAERGDEVLVERPRPDPRAEDRPRPERALPPEDRPRPERALPPEERPPEHDEGRKAPTHAQPTEPRAGAAQAAREARPTYERILGAFVVAPELTPLLDPGLAIDRVRPEVLARARAGLLALEAELRRRGEVRPLAAVLLDRAALDWAAWRPEDAWTAAGEAQRISAELGDVRGLAHAHEWLGLFLEASGARARAGEHLSVAHALYGLIGDEGARARLVAGRS